ncbi:MAG TPA: response regulator transcription factor [Croceibacterium sp.]
MKRVMLADDHAVVRRGLRTLIEGVPGWEVVAEAADGNETVAKATEARPDILIMDLSMPGLGGVDATIQIRKILPQIEVLILTMHESDRLAGQALRAGARGYLLKGESEDKLMEALEALSRHQPYFSPSVSETLLQGYLHSEPAHDLKQLTPRERQIVKLVAEGKSNKVIASVLNLSIKTVETHRSAAMHKVGAKSAADLTLYAARNDLVQL